MKVVLSLLAATVLVVILTAVGVPSAVAILVGIVGWITFISISRPSTSQQVTVASATSDAASTTAPGTEFSNVAFSDQLPSWKGWSKDVGVVTVAPSAVSAVGRKTSVSVTAPFGAELYDHKFMHWTMVKVTGRSDTDQPATVYLVVRGAPAAVMVANKDTMQAESLILIEAINGTSQD